MLFLFQVTKEMLVPLALMEGMVQQVGEACEYVITYLIISHF